MNRGCAVMLLGYGTCIGAFGYGVLDGFTSTTGTLAAVIGGIGIFLALNSVRNGVATARRARLVDAARSGAAPRAGKAAAVIGDLEPVGPALEAPLSGAPCIAHYSEIWRDNQARWTMVRYTPCQVRTDAGAIRLEVAPVPAAFFTSHRPELVAPERTRAWLEQTDFEAAGRGSVAQVLRMSLGGVSLTGTEPVSFAHDLSLGEPFDPERDRSREHNLPMGVSACVVGVMNADGSAVLARQRWPVRSAEIFVDDPAAVVAELRKKARSLATTGSLIGLAFVGLAMAIA